jgi:phosphoglycerol transferase
MSNMALLAVSTLLLLTGLSAAFFGKRSRATAVALGALVLIFFLLASAFLAANQFTGRGIDQAVLYHTTYGLSGAGFSEYRGLMLGITLLGLVGVGVAFASAWLLARERTWPRPLPTRWFSLPLVVAACALNPATKDLFVLFGASTTLSRLGHGSSDRTSAFAAHYRAPDLGPEPPARRNLVFIYAEGLERTYFDEALFPGLMVGMRQLEAVSTSFTNIDQTEGTSFTIGGMVGSQCGIPLVTSSGANSMSGMGRFLPEAICVGDLLSSRGYHMAYVGGASLRFAGKGEFLSAHGFEDRQGREELQPLLGDTEYRSGWGLYDDSLLDIAYDKFVALSSRTENFGLFLLTLDTHAPDGHLSKRVADVRYADGDIAILNAVAGTDRLLHAFVQRIMASPHAQDTVIVICSDHLAMKNGAWSKLNAGVRRNLFLIIDPQRPTPTRIDKPGTTLDVGPTVLHALGYHAKLGLGRDLLGDEPTLRQQLPDLPGAIGDWRRDLSSFWGLSELHSVKVLAESRTLEAGGATLRIPALITFDEALHSEVFFEFDSTKDLTEYVADLQQGASFIWVAPCNREKGYVPGFDHGPAGDCMIAGKRGARPIFAERIDTITELSEADLRRVLSSPVDATIYEEQGRGLLEAQLPNGIGELFRGLPPNSTFFQTKSRAAQRIARYATLPPLSAQKVAVTHTLPTDTEFYFTAGDMERVQASGAFDVSRVTFGDDLLGILRRHEPDTVIISAKDDARSRLSATSMGYFKNLGIDLSALKFRGSFAAVLDAGRPIAAEVKNDAPVVLVSAALRRLGIDRVESAGYDAGNVSRIIVGGKEMSNNSRGLNIVVLARDGRRLSLTIDTALSENLYLDVFKATPRKSIGQP